MRGGGGIRDRGYNKHQRFKPNRGGMRDRGYNKHQRFKPYSGGMRDRGYNNNQRFKANAVPRMSQTEYERHPVFKFLHKVLPIALASKKTKIRDSEGNLRKLVTPYLGAVGLCGLLRQSVPEGDIEKHIRAIMVEKHLHTDDRVQWDHHPEYGHESTSDPSRMCRAHPPLIWCNAMLPGDKRLNALQRIVT